MKPNNNIQKLIANLKVSASSELDKRVDNTINDELARRKLTESAQHESNFRRIIMKSPITKLAVAAIVVVAAGLAIYYFAGGGTKHCCAWEDIVRPIMDANTAELDIVVGEEGKVPVIHDMIMGSKIRRTMEGMEDSVSIIDLSSWKILTLETDKKKATYIDLKGLPQMPNYLDQLKGVIKMLQDSPLFAVKDLGEQSIDGQILYGFEAKHPQANIKIWADPQTALPVRIEQQGGQMIVICKNMRFDVPMSESLFDMNAPEGYKVEQQEMNLLGSTEQDFIEGLRVQAEVLGDGVFPDDVSVEHFIKMSATIKDKFDKLTVSDEEKTQLGMKLQKGLLFIRFFKGEGKWYYAGKGVHLGDADTTIFWYRPAGSQTYHVIYGDLSIEDANEQDLPQPVEKEAKEPIEYQQWDKDTFAGAEGDEWHITAEGNIKAHSNVLLTKGPKGVSVMPIKLPYTEAVLESATLGDISLKFNQTEPGKYVVVLPLEKMGVGETEIKFVWSLPLNILEKTQEGFRTNLSSLIPVAAYKLTIILDDGCGFENSREPAKREFVPFTGMSPEEPKDYFGSCCISITKTSEK